MLCIQLLIGLIVCNKNRLDSRLPNNAFSESNTTIPTSNSSLTDLLVKYYVTNPIFLQKIAQHSSDDLFYLNTLNFCGKVGDQSCIASNSNFKILLMQTSKDAVGDWIINWEAQKIASYPIKNIQIIWSLYDAQGNIVDLIQGSSVPSNLGIG